MLQLKSQSRYKFIKLLDRGLSLVIPHSNSEINRACEIHNYHQQTKLEHKIKKYDILFGREIEKIKGLDEF